MVISLMNLLKGTQGGLFASLSRRASTEMLVLPLWGLDLAMDFCPVLRDAGLINDLTKYLPSTMLIS